MSRKDPRFEKKEEKREPENRIVGEEIGNSTILSQHLAEGAIVPGKISLDWPIFNVGSSIAAGNNTRQSYNIVYTNINNCFSTTSSEFITPVTGVYHFTWSTIKADNSVNLVHRQYIRKDTGSGYVVQLGNRHLRLSEGSVYGDGTCSAILQLNRGDKIDIYIQSSNCASYPAAEYTWFQGYLIR